MYDTFSADYDRFVDWPSRLASELPFIEKRLNEIAAPQVKSLRLLDAACGTGMHAIALGQKGYAVSGADLSSGMVAQARANAARASIDIPFAVASFGELAKTFGASQFDALLCLGNSLPHLLDAPSLAAALSDIAACLQPGGLLIIQNRNFDAVLAHRQRWMDPQTYHENEREWIFLRFYDFDPDGLITFNILTLHRMANAAWEQHVTTTRLAPQRQADLAAALTAAGFDQLTFYGNLAGAPFDPENSPNLVVAVRLTGGS